VVFSVKAEKLRLLDEFAGMIRAMLKGRVSWFGGKPLTSDRIIKVGPHQAEKAVQPSALSAPEEATKVSHWLFFS
jgi:hypothetical protein